MPKYRNRLPGEKGTVKRSFKNGSEEAYHHFVAGMNKKQFASFQRIAAHYLQNGGGDMQKVIGTKPEKKILAGSLFELGSAARNTDVVLGMRNERKMHETDPHFHMGGGLNDGVKTITRSAFNLWLAGSKEYRWVGDLWRKWNGYAQRDPPEQSKMRADVVRQAYRYKKGETPRAELHGWKWDKEHSTKRTVAYVDDKTKQVFIGVRGTVSLQDWGKNVQVLTEGTIDLPEVEKELETIVAAYPGYRFSVSGHSQAGTALANLAVSDPELMNKFENIDLFNPGAGAQDQQGAVQNALKNPDKFHLYLNAGDVVSNGYINDIEKDRQNTYYGVYDADFLKVHSIDQWTTGGPEGDEVVETAVEADS